MTITSGQPRRPSRIPDQVWNSLREELVDTYTRDDVELKNIPKIIAEKHNITITEVQLKDRFRKWQIKKNIPESALAAISSIKRKRNALGKDARFKYNGFDVEPERLERALKRQKGYLPSPEFIPPSVMLCVTPKQSPQVTPSAIASQKVTLQNRYDPAVDRETFDPVFPSIGESLSDRAWALPLPQYTSVNVDPYGLISDNNATIALQPRSPHVAIRESPLNGSNVEDFHSVLREVGTTSLLNNSLEQENPQIYSRASSVKSASEDWSRFVEWSPALETLGKTTEWILNAPCDVHIGHSGWSGEPINDLRAAESTSIYDSPIFPRAFSMSLRNEDDLIVFDPEKLFINLQDMKMGLSEIITKISNACLSGHTVTGYGFQHPHKYAFNDKASYPYKYLHDFYNNLDKRLVESSWLQNQIEELLYQACVESARAIHKRLVRTKDPRSVTGLDATESGTTESRSSDQFPIRRSTLCPNHNGPGQGAVGFAMTRSSTGRITIHHRIEIITCVKTNDLHGVRMLFDRKEASPRDVNEAGFSLLSYAQGSGCHAVFELLLKGGADMYNVNCCAQPSDVITNIWETFLDEHCVQAPITLSDCIKMTRTALANGCDVSERVKQHRLVPDPLFSLCSYCLLDGHCRVPIDKLEYVLNLGYDLEEQNSDGLTPLLYAASEFSHSTVRVLLVLIDKKANLGATDPDGKNSLQVALNPFWLMKSWQTLELSDDARVYDTGHMYQENLDEEPFDSVETDHSLLRRSDLSDLRHGYQCAKPPSAYMEFEEVSIMSENSKVSSANESEDLLEIPLGQYCGSPEHYLCHPECLLDLSSWRICAEKDGSMRAIDLSGNYDLDLVPCVLYCGCTTLIRNPISILKRRMRFKLLTLLRAGCDPNHLDNHGRSASDQAREDNIWPEWTWALLKSGYVYDDVTGRWVKSSTLA